MILKQQINDYLVLNYHNQIYSENNANSFTNYISKIIFTMFQDLFDTQDEIATGVKEGQVQSALDRLPRTCADTLPQPQLARKKGFLIGLKNQGATCYLNSLLQILFHTPQLRKTILDLPLCIDNSGQKSDFLNASKHKFMLGFQRLFSEMSLKDTSSLSTQYLKQAFGWEGSQHIVQHDIQQAMKIIFDTFQRALQGTQYAKNIRQLFKGTSSRYKTCRNCTVAQQRLQQFYGLNLQVKNYNSLDQSILSYLNAQSMDGDNKIYCQICQSKQDMWLGTKLKCLPNVLVITLARFSFDYEKFDRIKVTSFFSFNLQYNLAHLMDQQEANAGNNAPQYELYGVLIHRGSAHSGHYLCYIRDIMQQSNWQKGLQQASFKQQKQQQQKQNLMTEQQKTRKQEKNKQDKKFELVEPRNKNLLQNWFELNDSIVTAIDATKITTKFEGSDSAYILFYRRKDIEYPKNIQIPSYFKSEISAENHIMQKQRQQYNIKKKQIILKIDGKDQILSVQTQISDLLAIYCQPGYTLVNQAKHNGLPYYPKQLNTLKQYSQTDTVKSLDLIHQSTWTKYQIDSNEYHEIQPYIQVGRMPFQINVYFNEKNQKLILYQDQTLTNLKLKVQQKYQIPYQDQIIKLVTAFRQYFVTDDLSNDDVLLTKLGFMHQCQIVLKKLQKQEREDQVKKIQQKIQTNTICFVIQRDDIHGIKRMYFDKNKTLKQLFDFVCESEGLDKQTQRRFRNLNGDRLFYNDDYNQTLNGLNLDEQIVKLRIERGDVPVKGDICVIAKIQSKFKQETVSQQIQFIFDPNTTILQTKIKLCEMANLKPQMHRLYQTDWMGEPARCITKQKQSIFDARFGREEKICIRDIESPIGAELINFEVYETKIGTPEDIGQPITFIKIQQHKTLKELKQQILKSDVCKDKSELKVNQLRVRQIKKDYMFGTIMRDNNKQLKNYNFNTNKIVVQILKQQEQLSQNQIVLILKKRNKEKRLFEGHLQLIFNASKSPTIQDFILAVKNKLQLSEQQKIRIAKYIHYDFQWIQFNEKYIDKFLKSKAGKVDGNKNKKKQEQKKGKQGKKQQKNQKEQKQELLNEKKTIQKHAQQSVKQVQLAEKKQQEKSSKKIQANQTKNKNNKAKKGQKQNKNQQQNEKDHNQKKEKPKNKAKQQKQPKTKQETKKQDCLNLRKAPYLLKDGDWIGYGKTEQIEGDDFQTDEDLTLRLLKRNEKAIVKQARGPQKAFKVNIDF